MAIRWDDLKNQILRVLDDLDRENPTWSDEDLLDYINDALVVASQHTAQEKQIEIALVENIDSFVLPDDYLDPGPVWVIAGTNRVLLTPIRLEPGQELPASSVSVQRSRYYEWPRGTLNFLRTLASGYSLRVHYWSYWDRVETDASMIRVPRWLEEAVKWACLARAMAKPGAQASQLGQYKTRREAGGPEDNPLLEYAEYCRRQYERIMAEHAPQDRGGWRSE